jgi:hypothetical protein
MTSIGEQLILELQVKQPLTCTERGSATAAYTGPARNRKTHIMRNKATYLVTLLFVPAAAALIANAPVATAATAAGGCAANEIPAGAVRTAETAGAVRSACTPTTYADTQDMPGPSRPTS